MTGRSSQRDPLTAIISQLEELIDALDRRIPQVARAGEGKIAQDAALLRDAAVARLAQLAAAGKRNHVTRRGRDPASRVWRGPPEQVGDESLLSFVPAYDD